MMRRILFLIMAFMMLFLSSAPAENEAERISFTLMDEGDGIFLSTSILPNQKIMLNSPEETTAQGLFDLLRPDLFPAVLYSFKESIIELNKQKTVIQKGAYAGDLFEYASEKEVLELQKEDLEQLCSDAVSRIPVSDDADNALTAETAKNLEHVLRSVIRQVFGSETYARISTFDTDQYLTVEIVTDQATVLTISADVSNLDDCTAVIGRRAGDAVYYEEITCISSGNETDYIFSLFRTNATALRLVKEQDYMQYAAVRFMKTDRETYGFDGELQSVLLPSAVHLKGSRATDADGKGQIRIEMTPDEPNTGINEILIPILYSMLQP